MHVFNCHRRWSVLLAVLALTFGLLAIIPMASAATNVHTDVSTFETATGATQIAWVSDADTLPQHPWPSATDYSCANMGESITTPGGEVTVSNPYPNWICYIGTGWSGNPSNTDPSPRGPTIVNNGEDDYVVSIKLSVPSHAVGFSLLTNSSANETITITYEDGTSEVFTDDVLDTAANGFEFVGFNSTMQITNIEINTTGGAGQNEGIEGIWLAKSLPTTSCPDDQYFVDSRYNPLSVPEVTDKLEDGHFYNITASGTFYAGGAGVYDIQADADYSQDRYARANDLGWTVAIGDNGGPYLGHYDETVLDLFIDGVAPDWDAGTYSPEHTYTVQRMGTGSPAVLSFAVYDTYPSNNVGGLCVALDIVNRSPVADAGGPYTANEGDTVVFDGSGSWDPDSDVLTYSWMLNPDDGDFTPSTGVMPSHVFVDNYGGTIGLTVEDGHGGAASASSTVTIANVPPTIESLSVAPTLIAVGESVAASATFTDPGTADTHTASWDWGDGTTPGTVTQGTGSGSVDDTHAYSAAGVYTVALTVTDDDGGAATELFEFVIVYDPSEGFVTGGGWIYSEAGNYLPDPTAEGKATFGFVSKYKKGASVPTGNTEFQFQSGDLNFHSSSYDWLVVTGSDYARYKGTGTINGEGAYKFMIWAGDNDPDTFRIMIWEEDELGVETPVYDNGSNQEIDAGSIIVHTKKK